MPAEPELVDCLDVVDDLTSVVDGHTLSHDARLHVAECLRCQAEIAQYRRLARTMRDLARVPSEAPPSLENEILTALDREDDRVARRVPARTAATLGGIAAAAGVIALATRGVTRQRRMARLAG